MARTFLKMLRGAWAFLGIGIRSSLSQAATDVPTIESGSGAASASEPNGSLYLRTGGVPEYRIGGAWKAFQVAGQAYSSAVALTAAGDGYNLGVTIAHATASVEGIDAAVAQLTTPRTSGVVSVFKGTVTSLAADSGGQYNIYEGVAVHAGSAAVLAFQKVGAGFDLWADLSSCASGEADVLLPTNKAVAAQWRDGATVYQTIITTTGSEFNEFGQSMRLVDGKRFTFGTDNDILYTHDGAASVRVTNAAAGTVGYDDDVLNACDPADPTKRARLDAGNVTAGQTRVISAADRDVDLQWLPQRAYVSITPAQLRALRATPITLVGSPGAGKALIFHWAKLQLDFAAVAHDAPVNAGDDIGVRYTGVAGQLVASQEATGLVNAGADAFRILHAGAAPVATVTDVVPVADAPLVAHNVGAAEYAGTGDSPLKFVVFYSVVTLDESA